MRGMGAYLKRWAEPPFSCCCGTAVAYDCFWTPSWFWKERIGSLALEKPDKIPLKRTLPHQSILLEVPTLPGVKVAFIEVPTNRLAIAKLRTGSFLSRFLVRTLKLWDVLAPVELL
jgi:hypothetical protein